MLPDPRDVLEENHPGPQPRRPRREDQGQILPRIAPAFPAAPAELGERLTGRAADQDVRPADPSSDLFRVETPNVLPQGQTRPDVAHVCPQGELPDLHGQQRHKAGLRKALP